MKPFIIKWPFLLLVLQISLIQVSCQAQKGDSKKKGQNKKENVDGGSCSYKHEFYPAVILWIDSTNVEDCNLQLCLPEQYNDTLYYSMKEHNRLKLDLLHSEKLKTGDTIIYQQSHMTEGSCNPFIERIVVKKYSKKNE